MQLMEGEELYISPLKCPTREDVIATSAEDIINMGRIKITPGDTVTEEESTFQGFVCDVNTIDDVNCAYQQLRYKNITADHIICATRLPAKIEVHRELYEDDGDHGLGKVLWEYMKDLDIKNRAIFVIRNTNGVHIGDKRFDALIQSAKLAMNKRPMNEVIKKFQFSWPTRGGGSFAKRGKRYQKVEHRYQQEWDTDVNVDSEDEEIAREYHNQKLQQMTEVDDEVQLKTVA